MTLTEDDLRLLLREAAQDAPTALTPNPLGDKPKLAATGRRIWWAGGGALATAAAVVIGLIVVSSGSDPIGPPAGEPAPADSPATRIGGADVPGFVAGTTWDALAYGDAAHAWAAGMDCTADTPAACHLLMASSADGGATWRPVTPPDIPIDEPGEPISLAAQGNRVWAGPLTSSDGGRSWQGISNLAPIAGTNTAMAYARSALQYRAPYTTSGRGGIGSECPADTVVSRLDGAADTALATLRSQGVYAASFGQVAGDGTFWTQQLSCPGLPSESLLDRVSPDGHATAVAIPADWRLVLAVDADTAYFTRIGAGLGVTHDGGEHVTPVPGTSAGADELTTIAAFDPDDLLLTRVVDGGQRVFASHDGGRTQRLVLSASNRTGDGVTVLDATSAVIVAPEGTIYRTDDKGESWQAIGALPAR